MMRYRFPILLTIWVSCLGLPPNVIGVAGVRLFLSDVAIAQTVQDPTTQDPAGIDDSQARYNRFMQDGYSAFDRKDYQKALQNFQEALKLRPDDPEAKSAVNSVQSLANPTNNIPLSPSPTSTQNPPQAQIPKSSPIPLYIGAGLLTLAAVGALVSLFSRIRPDIKFPTTARSSFKKPTFTSEKTPTNYSEFSSEDANHAEENSFNFPKFVDDYEIGDETSSLVQTPSRIPNVDLILQLIGELRDPEPRTRRRAIWKLAQMSDSRSMQPLVTVMGDADSYERSLILEAVSQICTRTLRPLNQALAISLSDKNPQVRKNAIRDLTRIYDIMSQITQLICHALDDSDIEVQETAKWAMKQLNIPTPPKLDFTSVEMEQNETDVDTDDIEEAPYTESTPAQEVRNVKKD